MRPGRTGRLDSYETLPLLWIFEEMSSLGRIAARAAETDTLFSVLFELTYRCNLDCFFCYNDIGKKGKPLPTERYLSLLEELRDMGVLNLTLSGGEPLAHPAFWEIGRKASDLAFATRVKTNGHAIDEAVARRLRDEVAPFMVEVSLHGATAESHDRQTRVPGSFDRLMRNLPAMIGAGLHVKLSSTITAWNVREIEAMYEIADRLGVLLAVNFTLSPKDDGDRSPLSIAPAYEEMEEAVRLLERRDEDRGMPWGADPVDDGPVSSAGKPGRKNCGAGASTLTVDPYGDVFPCVQWKRPIGNLHDRSLREIWFGNAKLEEIRDISVRAATMVDSFGSTGVLLAFCPGLAEMETGSPLKIYASARQRARAFHRPVALPSERETGLPDGVVLPVHAEEMILSGSAIE